MATEATVILSAINNVTGPTEAAAASLAKYEAAIDSLSALGGQTEASAARAAGGITAVGAASENSVVPHRAAHQALMLVSGSMVELAGGSAAAGGAVHVLDSIMFSMAMTGGALSLGFTAVIAVVAAVGYAFKSQADEAKRSQENLDKLTDSSVKYVGGLNYLNSTQKSVAGVGFAQAGREVMSLQQQISDLTEKMKENAEAGRAHQSATIGGAISGVANAFTGGMVGTDILDATNAAQEKMAENLRVLNLRLDAAKHAQMAFMEQSAKYKAMMDDIGNSINKQVEAYTRSASRIEGVGRALGNTNPSMEQLAQLTGKSVEELTAADEAGKKLEADLDSLGHTSKEAATIMNENWKSVTNSVVSSSIQMAQAIGSAAVSGKNAFVGMANAMIDAITQVAIQVVTKYVVMTQAAALFDSTVKGGLPGFLAGLAAIGAIAAVGAAMKAAVSATSHVATNATGGASSGAIGSSGGTATGPSGTAVSSAQSQQTNNVYVTLPVQALDLSSISDIQLKSLANRIGRVMADAAGQGQFSLVGA